MKDRSDSHLTRRGFLAAGVTGAVGALLGRPLPAADPAPAPGTPASSGPPTVTAPTSSPRLIAKAIPSSGLWVPAIGLGTDAFRSEVRDDIRAELKRMSELGGVVIDTAAAYGDSEALIGEALESLGLRHQARRQQHLAAGRRRELRALARAAEDPPRRAAAGP